MWCSYFSRNRGGVTRRRGLSSSINGLTATEGTDIVKLETCGDISEAGDFGELGVWKSTGDMRAGVVIADTYLKKSRWKEQNKRNKKRESTFKKIIFFFLCFNEQLNNNLLLLLAILDKMKGFITFMTTFPCSTIHFLKSVFLFKLCLCRSSAWDKNWNSSVFLNFQMLFHFFFNSSSRD